MWVVFKIKFAKPDQIVNLSPVDAMPRRTDQGPHRNDSGTRTGRAAAMHGVLPLNAQDQVTVVLKACAMFARELIPVSRSWGALYIFVK